MILHQDFGERDPHVAGVAKSMKQQNRRAATGDAHILGAVRDRHLLGTDIRGPSERLSPRGDLHGGPFRRFSCE
jgi:hypothetical protein